ncbi:MAG: hypothetical protein JW715_12240 [Sedimentisphaerales bacterium]|nr:hypothetical protein [Sedimentisphaerales bacterium]
MEREAIERLAIDSAAGQLNEDMQAIFAEYLAANPQANKWAEDMMEVYKMTETAISSKTKPAVRTDAGVKALPIFHWQPIARWAAVVVFSAFIGLAAGRWSKQPVVPQGPTQETVASDWTSRTRYLDPASIGESFWREKVLAMFQAKPTAAVNIKIMNHSLWEKYRQFIKERNYE